MVKEVIEYFIPIQGEERVEEHNKKYKEWFGDEFIPLKSTNEHIDLLIDKLYDAIDKVGDAGGWYLYDGIRVKIEVEYEPEDK